MLRRLGIRAKVLAVLAVPVIVLLAAGSFISVEALSDLRYARATQTVVRTLDALTPLSAALQQERTLSLAGGDEQQLAAAREATDDALAATREVTAQIDLSQFPPNVVRDFQDTQTAFREGLPQLRERIDQSLNRTIIKNGFQQIIDGQLRVVEGVANALQDRQLAQYISANRETAVLVDALVSEYIAGVELLRATENSPAAARSFQSLYLATELARERARLAVANLGIEGLAVSSGDPSPQLLAQRALFTQGNTTAVTSIDPAAWTEQMTEQLEMLQGVTDGVLAAADEQAGAAVAGARDEALLTIAAVVLGVVASVLIASIVARGIVVPLRRLTSAAADVREQLPKLVEQVAVPGEHPAITLAPIPVTTQDEVGRLAQAFNAVNAQTVTVAQEQAALRGSIAEMFVNVARRDQVLLNRQLSFIDSLERAEEDPGTLANLFRLDHLATRMRRNAESLLVLAGIDSGRRLRDAMPLSDVIRTASSEIEQYDRVELDLQVDPHMLGFNALSAAHLIAELLENATVFSEPETPVVVTTGISGASVVVRITDQGLGMTDAEMEAANHKIASVSASDALGAQRLGLFVVGRLAQRLGAEVTLRKRASGTGTEALVLFPSTLFSANEVNGFGAPPAAPVQAAATPVAEIEAPAVREVDLTELTDGQTSLGLPRRRRADDSAATPVAASAPAAPRVPEDAPIPVPSVAPDALPTRSRKTFDENNIVLPVAPEATLAPELSASTGEWAPAVVAAPRSTGLPSRTRAATSAWAAPETQDEAPQAAPADPAARAGLFSGFRNREALAPAPEEQESAPAAFHVPGLVPDEDEATAASPAGSGWPVPSWQEPTQDAAPLPTRGGGLPSRTSAAPDEATSAIAPWAGESGERGQEPAQQPEQEQPEQEQPWAPAAEAQPWAPVQSEPWAPVQEESRQAEAWAPAQREPWTPPQSDDRPWAQSEPWAPVQAESEPWAPAQAQSEPWAPVQAESEPWAPAHASAPSWSQDEPGTDDESRSWAAAAPASAGWGDQPQDERAEEQAAPAEETSSFTAYSGYSGWAGSADRPALDYTAPYVPFERTLDETRAWHTGAIPVVPEPTHTERPTPEPVPAPVAQELPSRRSVASALLEEDTQEEQPAPWAPVPAAERPAPAAPEQPLWAPAPAQESPWQSPQQQDDAPAAAAAAPAAAPTEEWRPAAPAWSRPSQGWQAPVEQPTQVFSPVEAAEAVAPAAEAPAPQAPAPLAQRQPAAPQAPAWQDAPAPAAEQDAPDFGDVVRGEDDRPKRRWGAFFSRRKDEDSAPETPQPTAGAPVRSSAWGPAPAPAPAPTPAESTWQAPAWAPQAPTPAPAQEQRPAPSWSQPEWSARPAPSAQPLAAVPQPSVPPSVAPRIGTLDDEVAAMLALRSDIQEQALSELSQLSAYRPSAVGAGAERLTKRVPSAVPPAPAPTEERPVQRDADQLRSRLSSFQSGTSRGRRAAGDPGGEA
ncbi:ATP-binding protein [Cellulomonas sp.]|uniref:ATP-binding protein n=1 Tax=Cellulomonas sp. TaxID=40001 RepID=UPI00281173B7|nr:ATP-binding protein [Cellulomonas sp.]